ncbi:RdgB/HAM1 family non-canonical purine NTP pyrophosphatase [Parvularcula sp. IMCC14364]|uniref:RdgB/HAM1 family non-canonical purine NTP pyrophosphatase n=1 Tax=Parvularcula sp. IMCC14364 TaxID=3067902 RepID=UPI002741787B|nr:RdgB/HAM1 family non-canonical purine NTP pyrophosphatase [Parvularcula sp. IMCC14364]
MTRKFFDKKLVLATHNKGKLAEFSGLLAPMGVTVLSAGDLNLPEPEETGDTFEANSALKALAAAQASELPALADDSGLAVTALNGDPGIYSARWAGPEKDFLAAMQRVEDGLHAAGNEDRSAAFICVLTLAWPDGHTEVVRGECAGKLIWPPRGEGGFGYDPMFMPLGRTQTFAEIPADEKKTISHRALAVEAMLNKCF